MRNVSTLVQVPVGQMLNARLLIINQSVNAQLDTLVILSENAEEMFKQLLLEQLNFWIHVNLHPVVLMHSVDLLTEQEHVLVSQDILVTHT